VNRKVRVLVFDEADRAHIPPLLKNYHAFCPASEESYRQLLGWLKATPPPAAPPGTPHVPATPPAAIAWPLPADSFTRRVADRKDEFAIFANMLSGQSAQRIFLIQGPSSTGKTALLHECMVYARHLGVPHAYVDFKGGVTLDEALASLLLDVDQTILQESSACPEPARPLKAIADLQQVRTPVLLLFDTYQHSPQDVQNWVETGLFQRIARCPALVVVIAGQKVPEQTGRSWTDFARTVALSPILGVQDWVDYAGRIFASAQIKREHVEFATLTNDGDPGRISAVLEAFAQRVAAAPSESGG